MSIHIDPEGNETDALFDLVNLDAREVLEISMADLTVEGELPPEIANDQSAWAG